MGGSNRIAANDDAINTNLMHVIFLGEHDLSKLSKSDPNKN